MSAGGVTYFIFAILFFAFFYILFGGFVDTNIDIANQQVTNEDLHPSQLRMDTVGYLLKYWMVLPILFLIIAGYMLIKNSLREQTGEVY